jgi:spore maturation protein CgeB
MLRIVFIGANWYGSNARSCAEGLRRLGHDVIDVDEQTFIPQVSLITSRLARRLVWFRLVEEFNNYILNVVDNFQPDIFLAFKGNYIYAKTLKTLSSRGLPLYNYFPDTSAFNHGKWLPKSLPEYDCVFYTKPFWYSDVTKHIALKSGYFLPHGYDPFLHRPVELDARDISDYGCDVSFIAFHSRYKEDLLTRLVRLRPDLNLCIWGGGWTERCVSPELTRCIKGFPLWGDRYTRGIQAARINLGIMNGPQMGASTGDLTTSRTYTIPASAGFMLHERNSEVLDLYREGEEIACFDSAEELAEQIDRYLAHPAELESIARAGYARCVPAYSYDNRMAELLRWHHDGLGVDDPQTLKAEHGQSRNEQKVQ